MIIRFNILIFSLFLLLTACGGGGKSSFVPGGNNSDDSRGKLVSATLISTKQVVNYTVKAYKVVYETIDTKGDKVTASGLLSIPQKAQSEKSPLISYQHGTIFLDAHAPTNSSSTIDTVMTIAGRGYIISAADYIGYGKSNNRIHPYVHADSLASASIDMLRASKAFLKSKNIKLNNQLFLAGYSEGGYATLALQKAIQKTYKKEFSVTASAAGAGPFDLTETSKSFANKVTNSKPAYISFLLKSYDSIYKLNSVSGMFQSQYVDVINASFDGQHSGSTINDSLTDTTADLFKPEFLELLKGAGNHAIKEKLALNNIYDWKPAVPTRFYHGKNDKIVPYSNSQKALETMRANGAKDVTLGDCFLFTHTQCAFPYLIDTQNFFAKYAKDL